MSTTSPVGSPTRSNFIPIEPISLDNKARVSHVSSSSGPSVDKADVVGGRGIEGCKQVTNSPRLQGRPIEIENPLISETRSKPFKMVDTGFDWSMADYTAVGARKRVTLISQEKNAPLERLDFFVDDEGKPHMHLMFWESTNRLIKEELLRHGLPFRDLTSLLTIFEPKTLQEQ